MNMKTLTETSTFRVLEPIAVSLLLHSCDECERFQSASRQV